MTFAYPTESNKAHPARLSPDYKSTVKRSPSKPLIIMRHTLSELTGPVYGHETVREGDSDLTTQHKGEPLGERIIVEVTKVGLDVRVLVGLGLWQVAIAAEAARGFVSVWPSFVPRESGMNVRLDPGKQGGGDLPLQFQAACRHAIASSGNG